MQRYNLTSPAGVEGDLDTLIATLEDGTREWQESLELPTVEAIVWQPYENGPSIGGNLLHIVGCEWFWLCKFVLGEEPPENDRAIQYDNTLKQYEHYWPTPPSEPIEWYFAALAARRARTIDVIRAHAKPGQVYTGRTEEFTFAWIVGHLVQHDSYHGGQAVLLHEMYKQG